MSHIANLILDASGGVVAPARLPPAIPIPIEETTSIQTTNPSSANVVECNRSSHLWRTNQLNKNKSSMEHQQPLIDAKIDAKIESNEGQKLEENLQDSPSSSLFPRKLLSLDWDRPATALKLKLKEPILTRRRKISVPEIGPMATVLELAMDSPTIPGRPPIHERSQSVPLNSCRQQLGENTKSFLSGPAPDEKAEITESKTSDTDDQEVPQTPKNPEASQTTNKSPVASLASSPFPSSLPTVTIPTNPCEQAHLAQQTSRFRLPQQISHRISSNVSSQPPEVPPKLSKTHQELTSSSTPKSLHFIPLSAWSSTISATFSVSTPTTSPSLEGRSSPKPWSFGRSSPKTWSITSRSSTRTSPNCKTETSPNSSTLSLGLHSQKSETNLLSKASKTSSAKGHGRHSSEDNTGLKTGDHGCSKQRTNLNATLKDKETNGTSPQSSSAPSIKDLTASSYPLPKQQCFLNLPTGYSPRAACRNFTLNELFHLQNQALSQALRFQVLSSRDVESLSRELRALDERCEYLRKIHHSLRRDRQSLHARFCSCLRNPRVARFPSDALLKLEVNLSELDRCIDACVSKLELAENRRMRVRQKLLEHVAAAAIVEVQPHEDCNLSPIAHMPTEITGENTPPRSPEHSPEQREQLTKAVSLHPNTSLSVTQEPLLFLATRSDEGSLEIPAEKSTVDPVAECSPSQNEKSASLSYDTHIYNDKDVFALMECVEEEMARMGM